MPAKMRKKAEDALLLALACGATVESAARQCRVSERTVFRRLAEPAFQQRLREMRADMVQRTTGALTAAGTEAVRALLELLKPNQTASVRLGAARAVLELGMKQREHCDFEERLAALEAAQAEQPGRERRW
jgi:hypothetical protein